VQAPPGRIRGILEWAVIILINAPTRTQTRDLWLWYHIELHAPTNSTQKLKLIGKGGQFTYTPTIFSDIVISCYDFCLNTCLVKCLVVICLTHVKLVELIWYLLIFVQLYYS
jgi:hypothetical protein